ncbi:hypothetical protein IIA29_12100 [candidate division KSB1 bacterium]|nr:hypothetical protein [candidate division KSB1 bacterium]
MTSGTHSTSKLKKVARTIIKSSLALGSGESLTIVTDRSFSELADALWRTANRISKNIIEVSYSNKTSCTHKLPEAIYASLVHSNACVIVTPNYLDEAMFDKARQRGSRIVILQNASESQLVRLCSGDLPQISNLSRKLADLFSIGKRLQLTSPSGTDAELLISRAKGIPETGLAQHPGELASVPGGEAYVMTNGGVDGRLVVDRIAGVKKKLTKPIVINVSKGKITQIKGTRGAEDLRKSLRKFGQDGRKIKRLGVGTNTKVVLGNSALEDERLMATVHITFGQDRVTQAHGKMLQAIKGLIFNPTLTQDGKLLLEDGKFVI